MDTQSAGLAHPAFVEVLKQITSDEAKILNYLPRVGLYEPLVDLTVTRGNAGRFIIRRHVGTIGLDAGCQQPGSVPQFVDNLCRLGLTEIPPLTGLHEEWRYKRILELAIMKEVQSDVKDDEEFGVAEKMIGMTAFGDSFRRACIFTP